MKTYFLFLFLGVIAFTTCGQEQASKTGQLAKNVDAQEFTRLMKDKPGIILDVRTKGEVDKGAIPGNINIDLFDDNFAGRLEELDKSKPVYVYCASGGRSGEAMDIMKSKGFNEIYNLNGGYSSWKKLQEK